MNYRKLFTAGVHILGVAAFVGCLGLLSLPLWFKSAERPYDWHSESLKSCLTREKQSCALLFSEDRHMLEKCNERSAEDCRRGRPHDAGDAE